MSKDGSKAHFRMIKLKDYSERLVPKTISTNNFKGQLHRTIPKINSEGAIPKDKSKKSTNPYDNSKVYSSGQSEDIAKDKFQRTGSIPTENS